MLVNITLIPFLLGIISNVSEDFTFFPEYLYEIHQTQIKYGKINNITKLNSTLTCHPVHAENLRCYLHDIMSTESSFVQNLNQENISSNPIQNEEWFMMEFNNRGVYITIIESSVTNSINLIPDIVSQFSIGINIKINNRFEENRYLGIMNENTTIGTCTTTYKTIVIYRNKTNETMDSKFQIKLLKNNFSSQKDLNIHIVKNRKNCTYSSDFANSFNGGKVTKYDHVIELINNKLTFTTILEVMKVQLFDSRRSLKTPMFKKTTQLKLIDMKSRK
ncbi:hypothetical protein ALC62_06062 [Cyphomyrmex costatus]|uniref:Vitellogenin domain-containing protein n=1 Tax=Cyphomyrmex costatus TaxID=456900 RepID=A0A195CRD1_9HYME|nr:hypothetical protein ALC62_06062 [Cyphomyrmex costatus]